MSFVLRDGRGGGVDDRRYRKEVDLPAVPRVGDDVDLLTIVALRVAAVRWYVENGTVEIALDDYDPVPAAADLPALQLERIFRTLWAYLEEAGWEAVEIGRIAAGIWQLNPPSSPEEESPCP